MKDLITSEERQAFRKDLHKERDGGLEERSERLPETANEKVRKDVMQNQQITRMELLVCAVVVLAGVAFIVHFCYITTASSLHSARMTACMGNLKNIGKGFAKASSSVGDVLPKTPRTMAQQLFNDMNAIAPMMDEGDARVFLCPLSFRERNVSTAMLPLDGLRLDYSLNTRIAAGETSAANRILAADERFDNAGSTWSVNHNRKAQSEVESEPSLLFMDGHAMIGYWPEPQANTQLSWQNVPDPGGIYGGNPEAGETDTYIYSMSDDMQPTRE